MYIIYFDEVKPRAYKQKCFWYGALAIPHESALTIEQKVSKLSEKYLGDPSMSKETEFHGNEIICGKGHFANFDNSKRIEIYKDLLTIIDSFDEISKIVIQVDSAKYSSRPSARYLKINEMAFMFLIEKTNELMKGTNSLGLLIGDYDGEVIDSSIKQFSQYKEYGTKIIPKDITNLIDTVHYTKSHHSRLIQLADIYVH